MPKRGSRLARRLAGLFDFPEEAVFNVPRITVVGMVQVIIENHRGLAQYGGDKVVVDIEGGQVTIRGRTLTIGIIQREEVIVLGEVESISFKG